MYGYLDVMRSIALDVEGEGASAPSGSDIGLDVLSSTDLLGFGLCIVLSLMAFKLKSFPFLTISSIGWMVVGFQVASNAASPTIMVLTIAIAAIQLLYGSKQKGW